MIFELAGDGAFDGPMTGIVDARSHFVDEEFALMVKKFKGEDADGFKGVEAAVCRSCGGAAELAEERFRREAIVGGFESSGRKINGNTLGEKPGGFDGNVFEFVGDQREAAREFFECGLIGVIGGDALSDAAYRGFGRRIGKTEMETRRGGREGGKVRQVYPAG